MSLLGMTRQSGGGTLAFTRTPGGSLVSMRSETSHFYYIFDALGSVIASSSRCRLTRHDPQGPRHYFTKSGAVTLPELATS